MSRHHFIGIDGETHACVHPEGQDPLLADWRRGETGTHPTWHDPLFWQSVSRQGSQDGFTAAQKAAKRNAMS